MPESGINTYFYQFFNCLGWIEIFVDENGLITEKSRQEYDWPEEAGGVKKKLGFLWDQF